MKTNTEILKENFGKVVKVTYCEDFETVEYIGIVTYSLSFLRNVVHFSNNLVLFTNYGEVIVIPSNYVGKITKITSVRGLSKEERDTLKKYHKKMEKCYNLINESCDINRSTEIEVAELKNINEIYDDVNMLMKLAELTNNRTVQSGLAIDLKNGYSFSIVSKNGVFISFSFKIHRDIEKRANASFIYEERDFDGVSKMISYSHPDYKKTLERYNNKFMLDNLSKLESFGFKTQYNNSFLELGDKDWLTYTHKATFIPNKTMLLDKETLLILVNVLCHI